MSRYFIPEDIILKILPLLPAKSLIRFTIVCKLWQSIISNPQFIDAHLATPQKEQPRVALLTNSKNPITYADFLTLTLPPQCKHMTHHAISYNGLICLANVFCSKICVWNPLTKRLKIIPNPRKYLNWCHCRIGFGFDSSSNDYKILRMVESSNVLEVELYSSNNDCWKNIQVPQTVPRSIVYLNSKCVQLETGVLYMDDMKKLVSFDLHNEEFGTYPYPLPYKQRRSSVLKFEDSVAMAFDIIGNGEVSLWTLDNTCGGEMCWIKRFNIEADRKIKCVFLNFGVRQILATGYDDGYFFYDYKKKATKKVSKDIVAVMYTESFVSLKGFEQTRGGRDLDLTDKYLLSSVSVGYSFLYIGGQHSGLCGMKSLQFCCVKEKKNCRTMIKLQNIP